MQIKRQERDGSVVVVLAINNGVAAGALRSQRERTVKSATGRNGSAKSVAKAWLERGRISTAIPLCSCYVARVATSILLHS